MKNKILLWIGAGVMTSMLGSCGDESTGVGEQFFDESTFTVTTLDTVSFLLSTVARDSIATTYRDRLTVGSYEDPNYGGMHVAPYFQIGISETTSYSLSSDDFVFDSLTMALQFDGYTYFDTEKDLPISIYRVDEDIELDGSFLYNTSDFVFDPSEKYGEGVIRPGKIEEDYVIEITLRESFGEEIFDMLVNDPEEFRFAPNIVNFFRGFVIVADSLPDGGVYGLKTTTSMNLYYHDVNVIPLQEQIFGFPITGNIYFNHYAYDRSGTDLAVLENTADALSSIHSENQAYVASGIGLGVRIDLPWLEDLMFVDQEFLISRATLKIKPVNKSFDVDFAPLPEELVLYTVNHKNQIIALYPDRATLTQDTDYDRNTYYEVDISSFILERLESRDFGDEGLFIATNDNAYFSSADRVYIGDNDHESPSELTLYIILNNEK